MRSFVTRRWSVLGLLTLLGVWFAASPVRGQGCIEQWLPPPPALPGPVTAAILDDPDWPSPAGPLPGRILMIAGGQLHQWDGTALTRLSADTIGSFGGSGNSLAVYNGEIYVSGFFNTIGTVSARGIARFDGAVWRDVRSNTATGFNLIVSSNALAVYNGELYFGGGFTTAGGSPSNAIIRWNGTQWNSLAGNAPAGTVNALGVIGGELYVGGEFNSVPGVAGTLALAKWNGAQWLGANLPYGNLSYTTEIGSHNGVPWIHGVYYAPASTIVAAQLVRKTPASWELLPGGAITGGPVAFAYAFAEYRGRMAVGGLYLNAGPVVNANDIAFHSGGSTGTLWSRLLGGIGVTASNHAVTSLVVYRDELHAFGNFSQVNGLPQTYWARWYEGPPIVTNHPATVLVTRCDVVKTFTVMAQGASSYQWRRSAIPIADGPTGNGGTFAGTGTATLTINNTSHADAGSYDCVVTNPCGSVTSNHGLFTDCRADFDCNGTVTVSDIFAFLTAWFGANPAADFDGSGPPPTVADIFAFLTAWFGGCF